MGVADTYMRNPSKPNHVVKNIINYTNLEYMTLQVLAERIYWRKQKVGEKGMLQNVDEKKFMLAWIFSGRNKTDINEDIE